MKSKSLTPLLAALLLLSSTGHAQMLLHRSPYQLELGPALYVTSEDTGWGAGIAGSFALGDSTNPRHYVGLSFDYIADDYEYGGGIEHEDNYLMFLFRYKWYTPELAGGRIQPYLGFGAGNTIVSFEESPTHGKDKINLTCSLDAGADFALSSWFALNLRYSAIGIFDIDRFQSGLITENDLLNGFRLGGRFSW
jgi:opacity protein-like surface antigen